MLELCENTTRSSPRQRSHSRLDPSEVLPSDAAGSDVDAARPARRRDHHDITTTRRTASQPPPYPCRRLHGSSLARSGAAIPSNSKNATPCYPQNPRRTSCRHTKTPEEPTPALVSVSVPTSYDTGAGAAEPIIPPMFVYVQGRSRRRARQPVKPRRRTPRPVSFP